jgi:hypothetical protein
MRGSTQGRNPREVLENLTRIVPRAQIVRSHRLFQEEGILDLYMEYGLRYDLTPFEYQNPNPKPYRYWNGLLRLPFNFSDDSILLRREKFLVPPWTLAASLLICDFHPIHIYLNTDKIERYLAVKKLGPLPNLNPKKISAFVNRDRIGVRTLFTTLIKNKSSDFAAPLKVSMLMAKLPVRYASPFRTQPSALHKTHPSWHQ